MPIPSEIKGLGAASGLVLPRLGAGGNEVIKRSLSPLRSIVMFFALIPRDTPGKRAIDFES